MRASAIDRDEPARFPFGSNWRSFIELIDEPRIRLAMESLTSALGRASLQDQRFLDVGCGSGLFSLAAHRLGARVRAFDLDPESVAASAEVRRRFAPASDWLIERGSILDDAFTAGFGTFDIVYAWGVLHHTGDMWTAIGRAAGLVADHGQLFLSIYNDQGPQSAMWRSIKRRYNRSGPLARRVLVAASAAYLYRGRVLGLIGRARNGFRPVPPAPPRVRGMSARHDLIDWVGGYPFETAKPEQVFDFMRLRGFELRFLKTCGGGIGCNQFVFERAPGRLGEVRRI